MGDPFEVLGLRRDAGEADVRRAFWAKARAMHPDRHPGDRAATERFRRVVLAYEDALRAVRGEPPRARRGWNAPPRPERPDPWVCDGCGDGFAYGDACPRCDVPLRDARSGRAPCPATPPPEPAASRPAFGWLPRVEPRPWWLGAACLAVGTTVLAAGLPPAGVGIMLSLFGLFVVGLDLHDRLRGPAWLAG